MNRLNPSKLVSRSLIGAVGLSAIALLGVPDMVKAQPACGPGDHWVDTCPPGVDSFPLSWAYLTLLIEGDINPTTLVLEGPAKVTREAPVDFIAGDPLRGNVGMNDGHIGVIPTLLEESFVNGGITLTGIGYGAIVEAPESNIPNPELASSFFNVFATIDGAFGKAKNDSPITVYGNKWLVGVPPNDPAVAPVSPPPPLPNPWTPTEQADCDATDPLAAIIYCGFEDVLFYKVNDAGLFVDTNGDPLADQNTVETNGVLVATLLDEKHVVHPIPEPSSTVALLLVGLGSIAGLKRKNKTQE